DPDDQRDCCEADALPGDAAAGLPGGETERADGGELAAASSEGGDEHVLQCGESEERGERGEQAWEAAESGEVLDLTGSGRVAVSRQLPGVAATEVAGNRRQVAARRDGDGGACVVGEVAGVASESGSGESERVGEVAVVVFGEQRSADDAYLSHRC